MLNAAHATVFNQIGFFFVYLMRHGGLQGAAPGQYFTPEGLAQGSMGFARNQSLPRYRGTLGISGRRLSSVVETHMILPCKVVMLVKLGSWASWSPGPCGSRQPLLQSLKDPLLKSPSFRPERDLDGDLTLIHHFNQSRR